MLIRVRFIATWKTPDRARRRRQRPDEQQSTATIAPNPSTPAIPLTSTSEEAPALYTTSTTTEDGTTLPESLVISQDLARNSLTQFFQHGIPASPWSVFQSLERMRICYVGTKASNLAHLTGLDRRHPTPGPLHLPHPAIRPEVPWKPEVEAGSPANKAEDYFRDLSAFPTKDVRDSLVDSYFEKINCFFPIVDECEFRRQYPDPTHPPALLLLQSVLLAGAHVSDHPMVEKWRPMVCSTLFRRAKRLFDLRHENDRMHLVQSALLFTWYLENADTGSANSYYWAGVACRIAFGLGMHRDLSGAEVRMPLMSGRRMYRRIWWTLFQVEIFTALEHGRPSMVHLDEIDQAPLCIDDFAEENGTPNGSLRLEYSRNNIELCYIILEILRLNTPGMQTKQESLGRVVTALDSRLAAWMLKTRPTEQFGSLQLHLHYHTTLLHLHRKYRPTSAGDLWQNVGPTDEICSSSVSALIYIFEMMQSKRFLSQCYFTSVIALTAAAIYISQSIKNALEHGHVLLVVSGQQQLEKLFGVARELSVYWPNAEGVLKLFQSMSQNFNSRIGELLDKDTGGSSNNMQTDDRQEAHENSQRGTDDIHALDWNASRGEMDPATWSLEWQDLFMYPDLHRQFLADEDWMNISPRFGTEI
jgi:transcriptional regulatory protein AMDR